MSKGFNVHHSLEELYEQLMKRDHEDAEISRTIQRELAAEGLETFQPKRKLTIHTDEIVGADNVAKQIITHIAEDDRIITIEGLSGVGKGTTAHALKGELSGLVFSFGEVFRYLTFMENVHNDSNHEQNLSLISHRLIDGALYLFRDEENLSQKLKQHLQDPYLASQVPAVARSTQGQVIRFIQSEIIRIKNLHLEHVIILEGRDYTLDYLPSDLRIELCAHPMIRAKRRLGQYIDG